VFIQRNFASTEATLEGLGAELISMVPCHSVDNDKFKEGGRYYEEFSLNEKSLCPERGDVNYGGSMGTNLWVIPDKNSEDFDIYEDSAPYYNNQVDVWYVTESFDIVEYVNLGEYISYNTKYF
jgi:hypothetical protein